MIQQSAVAALFILMSVVVRLLPHPPNFAPIVGVGLFCGAYLPKRWAVVVPFLAMAVGDLMLGWVPENLFGWVAMALTAVIGFSLRRRRSPAVLAAASVAGSTLFFLISNFGVWALGCGKRWYPPTGAGLAACYVAGIPFYRNGLMGDLLYTGLLFGSYGLAARWISRRTTETAAASRRP